MDKKNAPCPQELKDEGKGSAADDIFKQTKQWLAERGSADCVPEAVLQRYAVASARWLECEDHITKYGLFIRAAASAAPSPYVGIAQAYFAQANKLWMEIIQLAGANKQMKFF